MQYKSLIVLVALIAVAQAQIPALSSLSSKLVSIASSDHSPARSTHISSASSALSRISSEIARTTSAVGAATTSSGATAAAQTQTENDGSTIAMSNTLLVQISALAALFVVSFIALLA